MVITLRIGQSAGKGPKQHYGELYGSPSTTGAPMLLFIVCASIERKRMSVNYDRLTTLSLLKI